MGPISPGIDAGKRKPTIGLWPLCISDEALSEYRFRNPYNAGTKDSMWTQGQGIGMPDIIAGTPWGVCSFGVHAEPRGSMFVNATSGTSDPVLWGLFPMNYPNHDAIARMQTHTAPEQRPLFHRNVFINRATAQVFECTQMTTYLQKPGDMLTSHSYHFGVGLKKIAIAYGWFPKCWREWHDLSTAAELPYTGTTVLLVAADEESDDAVRTATGAEPLVHVVAAAAATAVTGSPPQKRRRSDRLNPA